MSAGVLQHAERRRAAHRNAQFLGRLGAVLQHQRAIGRIGPRLRHHARALAGIGGIGDRDALGDFRAGDHALRREQIAHRGQQLLAVGFQSSCLGRTPDPSAPWTAFDRLQPMFVDFHQQFVARRAFLPNRRLGERHVIQRAGCAPGGRRRGPPGWG